ncbi:hypothetical protein J2R98_001387 [Alkalibacillus filiformis]|uniref:Uncharacterized protein n=1 Tax=Alkalibacillus filiformis TaxID=200990 RepID=A0ABU0DT01_9BACI|nr:hypothetical protein [Alkalibacillus filiformis]MDQ0351570.1 hypothetical protein [Alkalibacillus filiformis]
MPSFDPPNDRISPYIKFGKNGMYVDENAPESIRKEAEEYINEMESVQNMAYGEGEMDEIPIIDPKGFEDWKRKGE